MGSEGIMNFGANGLKWMKSLEWSSLYPHCEWQFKEVCHITCGHGSKVDVSTCQLGCQMVARNSTGLYSAYR